MKTLAHLSLAFAGFVLCCPSESKGQDRLYTVSQDYLFVLDQQNGEVLETHFMLGPGSGFPARPAGLVATGSTLYTVDWGRSPDVFVKLHGSNGTRSESGLTGLDWTNSTGVSLARDPTSGVLYVTGLNTLYRADESTGALSLVAPITGLTNPAYCVCCITVDSTGRAIGTGVGRSTGFVEVYDLDLSTGVAQHIGDLAVGTSIGSFLDLAISSAGEYWGIYSGAPGEDGLYKIDLPNLTATLVRPFAYRGIAFGPDCFKTTYCTPKDNSLGCTPAISMQGLASASATSGFRVECSNVLNQSFGALFFSLTGQSSLPFAGGTLCLASPMARYGGLVNAGGSPRPANDCTGSWSVDFNALVTNQGLGLPPGTVVDVQWMGRDRGFGRPNSVALSAGAEFWLCP